MVFCIDDFSFVYSEVVDKAGVDPLITLLNDVKPLVQANAAVCLTNLATEGKTFLIGYPSSKFYSSLLINWRILSSVNALELF